MAEYFQLPYDEAVEAVEATAGASEADQDARDVLLAALAQGSMKNHKNGQYVTLCPMASN